MDKTSNKTQISWINAMKLIACFFVFVTHYNSFFFFMDASSSMSMAFRSAVSACTGIANGTLWVMVFCFISGVFSAGKKIDSVKTLLGESFYRYLRLLIPVFITGFIIFIMSQMGILMNKYAKDIFNCETFFDDYYMSKIGISEFLKGAFLFEKSLNAPLWMMWILLTGNIIIYVCNYISGKLKLSWAKTALYILSALICLMVNSLFIMSCIMGAIFSDYILNDNDSKNANMPILIISIVLLGACFIKPISNLIFILSGLLSLSGDEVKYLISSCSIIIFVKSLKPVRSILSAYFINSISKFSYTIYLIHWPILCSLALFMYKELLSSLSYDAVFSLVFVVSLLVILMAAVLYSMAFDKPTGKAMRFVREKIDILEGKKNK